MWSYQLISAFLCTSSNRLWWWQFITLKWFKSFGVLDLWYSQDEIFISFLSACCLQALDRDAQQTKHYLPRPGRPGWARQGCPEAAVPADSAAYRDQGESATEHGSDTYLHRAFQDPDVYSSLQVRRDYILLLCKVIIVIVDFLCSTKVVNCFPSSQLDQTRYIKDTGVKYEEEMRACKDDVSACQTLCRYSFISFIPSQSYYHTFTVLL